MMCTLMPLGGGLNIISVLKLLIFLWFVGHYFGKHYKEKYPKEILKANTEIIFQECLLLPHHHVETDPIKLGSCIPDNYFSHIPPL